MASIQARNPSNGLVAATRAECARATTLSLRAEAATVDSRRQRLQFIRNRTRFLAEEYVPTPLSVRRVIEIVSDRYGQRQTLTRLGSEIGVSPWHLNLVFHRAAGVTIREYATSLRMLRALEEIARGTKVEAVASDLGYASRQSFYRQFRYWFGATPSRMRGDR